MIRSSHRSLISRAILLAALWAAFVVLGAAHGFWRPPAAPRGDTGVFGETAAAMVERDLVGNAVLVLLEDGDVVATYAASREEPVDTRPGSSSPPSASGSRPGG